MDSSAQFQQAQVDHRLGHPQGVADISRIRTSPPTRAATRRGGEAKAHQGDPGHENRARPGPSSRKPSTVKAAHIGFADVGDVEAGQHQSPAAAIGMLIQKIQRQSQKVVI